MASDEIGEVERNEPTTQVVPVPPPDRGLPDKLDRAVSASRAELRKRNWLVVVFVSRRFWFVVFLIVAILASIYIPRMFWNRAPELSLNIAILDKTVPFTDYRAHRGLFWLLGQNKFVDDSLPDGRRWYDQESDYIGFYPPDPDSVLIEGQDAEEPVVTRGSVAFAAEMQTAGLNEPQVEEPAESLPPAEGEELSVKGDWHTDLLKVDDLVDRDVLYIADTYGVYTSDYYARAGREVESSDLIFGGFSESEVEAAEWFASQGRLVIGEFNSFASPTPKELRQRLENIFGVRWTGWSGRYFVNFADETDVPFWLKQQWEGDNRRPWDLEGAGYLFVNDESGEYVILKEGIHVEHTGLELQPGEEFAKLDAMQGVEACTFCYWFDIVEAEAGVDVLADFDLHLTPEGAQIMAAHGIRGVFPAVTRRQTVFAPAAAEPPGNIGPLPEDAGNDIEAPVEQVDGPASIPAADGGGNAEQPAPAADDTAGVRHVPPRGVAPSGEWEYLAYYMAGNMMDFKMDMGPHNTRLTMYINRSFYSQPVVGSQGYFFWHTYYPMVSNILRAEANRLSGIPDNVFLFD